MTVTLESARREIGRIAIANMLQLYIHDFAAFMPPERKGLLSDEGLFVGYPLDPYFIDADREPLLIREGGRLAGFALLDRQTHTGAPLNWNMGEFFIARAHRRGGVGTTAARAIFTAYPGLWQVAVARLNLPALPFWRNAVSGAAGIADLREEDVQSELWNGPVLSFEVRGPSLHA
jgi:predicted acetyltransferase